jgi:hypothetical protein
MKEMHNLQYVNCPIKTLKGLFAQSQRGLFELSPLRSGGLRIVRRVAGPCERQSKALITKLAQGGHQA